MIVPLPPIPPFDLTRISREGPSPRWGSRASLTVRNRKGMRANLTFLIMFFCENDCALNVYWNIAKQRHSILSISPSTKNKSAPRSLFGNLRHKTSKFICRLLQNNVFKNIEPFHLLIHFIEESSIFNITICSQRSAVPVSRRKKNLVPHRSFYLLPSLDSFICKLELLFFAQFIFHLQIQDFFWIFFTHKFNLSSANWRTHFI